MAPYCLLEKSQLLTLAFQGPQNRASPHSTPAINSISLWEFLAGGLIEYDLIKQSFTAELLVSTYTILTLALLPHFTAGETKVQGSQGEDLNSLVFLQGHSCCCFHL